jgi:hypothetical protein
MSSWYVVYVRGVYKDGKTPGPTPSFPLVGEHICHKLTEADAETNSFWDKIQDGSRPAWAPDLLRMGYCLVFKRDSMPRMVLSLDIKSPEEAAKQRGRKRALSYDDVWVVGVEPKYQPFYNPPAELPAEDWWLETPNPGSTLSSYVAPGGATVVEPAQRMVDLMLKMFNTPNGYPRPVPNTQEAAEWESRYAPLVDHLMTTNVPRIGPPMSDRNVSMSVPQYQGMQIFRW